MKLDAHDHPKILDFEARLGVELPTALGHLELLWGFAARKAPQGNVGKWPDGAIARASHWRGAPDLFIAALVDAGLLDRDPTHRLVVHDWHDHAQNWVRAALKKNGVGFLSTSERSVEHSSEHSEEQSEEASSCARAFPSPSKPIPAKGSETARGARARAHVNGHGSKGKGRASEKLPIPADFSLTEPMRLKAIERYQDCDPERMFEDFRAYHERQGSRFSSWPAAWITWLGNAAQFGYPRRSAAENPFAGMR